MKYLLIILLGLSLCYCSEVENEELLSLRKENDSLRAIISEVKNKYVFDNISVRTIPSYENTDKLNSISRSEIVFIGYNDNGNSRVIFNDPENPNIKYSDTLKMENGAFILERKLTKEKNFFNGKVESENDFGKIYGTLISIGVLAH